LRSEIQAMSNDAHNRLVAIGNSCRWQRADFARRRHSADSAAGRRRLLDQLRHSPQQPPTAEVALTAAARSPHRRVRYFALGTPLAKATSLQEAN